MAREVTCLCVPYVSFFAGANLFTEDQSLVQQGKMFFSRDVQSIMNYLDKAKGSFFYERNGGLEGLERCKQVQNEILDVIDKKIKEYLNK
jgi:predicted glycosyltransferase